MDIGSLQIKMSADVAQLRTDMAEAKRTVDTTVAGIQRAAGLASAALGAIGVGLSAAAMIGFVRRAIDAADALDEMSQRVGVSASTLSSLQLAYRQSGMNAEAMATSLAKLSKEMSDGNDGLKALGVNARNTDGTLRSSTSVLMDVADRFKAMEDGAGETALAMEIFGKSGAQMVPLLNLGSEGIQEMMDRAKQLGLIISDDTAKAAGDFNDTMELLGLGLQGVGTRIAAEMLPTLNALAGSFLETMAEGDKLSGTAEVLADSMKALYSTGVGTVAAFSTVGKTLAAAAAQAAAIARGDFAAAVAIGKEWSADLASSWEGAGKQISMAWAEQGNAAVASAAKTMRASNDLLATYKAQESAQRGAAKVSDFERLMIKIREKTELQTQEAQSGRALTEAERMRVEIMGQIVAGQVKLTAAERAAIDVSLAAAARGEANNRAMKAEADMREQLAKAAQQSAQSVLDRVQSLRDEETAAALATATNISLAAALEQVYTARLLEAQAKATASGNTAEQEAITREIEARKELAGLIDRKQGREDGADAEKKAQAEAQRLHDQFMQGVGKTDFAAGFDSASQSLGVFVQTFTRLIELQEKFNEAQKANAGDPAKQAEEALAMQRAQIHAYGDLAGAAKGFFKSNTAGYKALSAVERAFRAYELAMAVKSAAEQIGLIDLITGSKIAGTAAQAGAVASGQAAETAAVSSGEAARNSAKIPGVIMAFMSALGPWGMAAAGIAIAAVLGAASGAFDSGGFASHDSLNNGTGTVLGDPTAQSESIAKAVEKLQDIDTMTMRYSAQMLAALKSIEANISGVTTLLVRSGGIESATSGIKTGAVKADGLQGLIGIDNNLVGDLVANIPLIGGALQNMLGRDFQKLFGSSQSIVGSGIYGAPQTVNAIDASGFNASYYADVEKKSKFLGMTTSTQRSTQYVGADAELARQFGLIVTGFADTLSAAAGALGISVDTVKAKLNSFIVDIGHISLQGLSAEQINERLTAVFGALGDNMAKAAITGFADFQAVGEGYLETVVRVATGVEDARNALRGLGLSIADLASVTNKQSDDIGAELVRQSILAAESSTRSVQRTVTDIVTTWKQIPWDPSKYGRFAEVMNRIAPMMMQVAESVTRVVTELETIPNGIGEIIQNLQGSAEEIASAYRTLTGLRDSLRLLSLNGDAVSYSLLNGAGGLQALSDSVAAFEESFFSESDKVNFQASRMAQAFQKLGFSLPMSKDGFVALVRGIDTSTDAGKELLGSVLGLSSGLAELLDSMESLKSSALANTDAFESKYLTTFERVALQSARMAAQFQSIGVAMPASIEEFKALVLGIDSGSQAGKDLLNKILPLANDFGSLSDSIEALSEAAIASTGSFERNVLSPFERIALQSTRLSSQFQDIGIAMPKNNEEFRSLVLGIDSSTEAGRSLLNKILPLADGFTTLTDSITSVGKAVSDEITRIRGLIGQGSATQNFASLQAEFAAKTAAARAGEKSALDALPHLSKDLLDLAGQQASSRADLVRMQAATAASLQTTLDIVKGNLNTGTDQNASLVSWMNGFKSVPNAGTDQSASLVSWMDALKQVQTPVIQTPTVPAPVVTPPVTEAPVSTPSPVVNPNAGQPDWAGYVAKYADLTAEFQRLMSGSASDAIRKGITTPELYGKWQFENQWAAEGGWRTVPTFAVGGMHAGGLRIVGEHGPELEASGAARYYSAEQTAQMWRGGGGGSDPALLAELQALRSEVAAFRQESQAGDSAIASHTGKAARILERVTPDGDAFATREAEAV